MGVKGYRNKRDRSQTAPSGLGLKRAQGPNGPRVQTGPEAKCDLGPNGTRAQMGTRPKGARAQMGPDQFRQNLSVVDWALMMYQGNKIDMVVYPCKQAFD